MGLSCLYFVALGKFNYFTDVFVLPMDCCSFITLFDILLEHCFVGFVS